MFIYIYIYIYIDTRIKVEKNPHLFIYRIFTIPCHIYLCRYIVNIEENIRIESFGISGILVKKVQQTMRLFSRPWTPHAQSLIVWPCSRSWFGSVSAFDPLCVKMHRVKTRARYGGVHHLKITWFSTFCFTSVELVSQSMFVKFRHGHRINFRIRLVLFQVFVCRVCRWIVIPSGVLPTV